MDVPKFWDGVLGGISREDDELGSMTKVRAWHIRERCVMNELHLRNYVCSFWLVELCTMWKVVLRFWNSMEK